MKSLMVRLGLATSILGLFGYETVYQYTARPIPTSQRLKPTRVFAGYARLAASFFTGNSVTRRPWSGVASVAGVGWSGVVIRLPSKSLPDYRKLGVALTRIEEKRGKQQILHSEAWE